MKKSIRRIANAVLATGVLVLTLVTLSSALTQCATACNMATIIFGVPDALPAITAQTAVTMTTDAILPPTALSTYTWSEFFQVTGIYLVTLAVLILVILEAMELYYLRRMFGKQLKFLRN